MVAKIPFHGKFVVPGDSGDTPAQGTITITPSNEVRDPAGNVILTMVPRVYELDANGEVSGALYATDDATVPSGWTYTVKETLLHPGSTVKPAYQRVWTLVVLKATVGTLELADVSDAQPVTQYQEFATWTDLQNAIAGTDPAGSAATAQTAAQSYADENKLAKTANLSDLANAATARTNLGLGSAATKNTGMATGTVAAGDDVRLTGATNLQTITAVGDSITNNGGALDVVTPTNNQQWYVKGFTSVANAFTGHRLRWVAPGTTGPGSLADPNASLHSSVANGYAFAVGGLLTNEILSLGYMTAAVASAANIIVVAAGTNDANAGVDGNTIAANLLAIWRIGTAAGKRVVATTIMPRDTSVLFGAKLAALNLANQLIRKNAAAEPGVYLCDWHAVLLDANAASPTSPTSSQWFIDGLHPSSIGGWRLGQALAVTLNQMTVGRPTADWLPIDPADVLTPNPYATGGTTTATSWTVSTVGTPSSGPTPTKVARTDMVGGALQQIAVTAANPNSDGFSITITQSNTSLWSAGDIVYGFAEIWADAAGWDCRTLQLDAVKSGASTIASANALFSAERNTMTQGLSPAPVNGIVLVTPRTTLDSGLTAVRAILRFWGSGTVRIGRMGVAKVV